MHWLCIRVRAFRASGDGAAAVEFAFIAPFMMAMLLAIVVLSFMLCTYSSLQQIAADAVRAALAGQTSTQQAQFASQYVSGVIGNYGFLDPTKLTVSTSTTATTLSVALKYDASSSFFTLLGASSFAAPALITRSATVQMSGF